MSVKTTVITGATSGIGKATAFTLAKRGHALYLLVRDIGKGEEVKKEIARQTGNQQVFIIKCDLSELQSVRLAAEELSSKLFNINLLINNAGGMFVKRKESADGFEMTFAVNYLGHFALTHYLMPLLARGHARIINVSSEAYRMAKPDLDDLQLLNKYSPFKAYANSKLFNIYFTKSLAEKYADKGILAYALHPGMVNTAFGIDSTGYKIMHLLARPWMITPEKAVEGIIHLASNPKIEKKSGAYFKKLKPVKSSSAANDNKFRDELWNISSQLINVI
jgi:NAD(P)-dependent dehydrogenase (short-subunit alcohol dehydrogenase family)